MLRFAQTIMVAFLMLVSIATSAQEMDFGGMYGSGAAAPDQSFNNPATNATSCPEGYIAYQFSGTPNVDWSAYWCGRPHVDGVDSLFDFGGMYGYSSSTAQGAVPWKGYDAYVNPFTHTDTCPSGYISSQVLGTPNVDNLLFFCYRTHTSDGFSTHFGGMSGDGASPFPNVTTGQPYTCPATYIRYSTYGTPNVDYRIFYCTIGIDVGAVSAGNGSLGIGEPFVSNTISEGYDLQAQIDAIIAMNPRVVRMWMLSWQEFSGISDGAVQQNTTNIALYKNAIAQLRQAGITIVGMDNSYPAWATGSTTTEEASSIPCPSSGAAYQRFLAAWEVLWEGQARAFPEIDQWEVGNELNGASVLTPITEGAGSCGKTSFNYEERVRIALDLMYWGNKGIKIAHPDATVFMPAAAPVTADDSAALDTSLRGIALYISDLYTAMNSATSPSSNKRDFFDGANWHPYIFQDATEASWIAANEAIHDVLEAHGDANIPVIFSEAGYTTPDDAATQQYMEHTIDLTQRELPWVRYLVWFRAFAGAYDPEYALLVGYPFRQTRSAQTFCSFTGCNNLPYQQF